ncbi:LysR family transcriptional regulator [Adlercreutzia equolifaciens]|uniref:LysR family transcriptional regulator n=1 Tax=Adlercreutzia equolifaciens TaxID=446660 RepID=UPI0023AEF697|nr:LysR family transcriptional regulator [Adlercreutzia equolifaciens]MDE8702376.1 LysR family transcriptional regulator [Adlercreutzia equolifaciens]
MLYDYLAEFVEVCRAGSMSRAALSLSLSQPALSRHMHALEQDLGIPLLQRTEHGCFPTALGEAVLDRATDIIETADAIRHLAQDAQSAKPLDGAAQRPLVFCGDIATASIPGAIRAALAALGQGRTKVAFRGAQAIQDATLEELLFGGEARNGSPADAVLLFQADKRLETDDARIVVESVWKEPFYLAVKPDHPLASVPSVSMDSLEGQVFVFPRGDFLNSYTGWEEFKRLCNLHGFTPRSVSKPFQDEGDVYSWDITHEVCPINRNTPIAPAFFEGDFTCVPVRDEYYPHLAIAYRADDDLIAQLAKELRRRNRQIRPAAPCA